MRTHSLSATGILVLFHVLVGFVWTARAQQPAAAAKPETNELVQEALQREAYGLTAERAALLRTAIQDDADAPQPHWYLGEVRSADGGWEQAGKAPDARAGQLVREYRMLRDSTADDAQGQKSLADWCSRKGLKQQERVHLLRSLSVNPQQADVRQRLGLVKVGQQWFEPAAYERLQSRAKALRDATEHWRPIFTKLAPQVLSPNTTKRESAKAEIMAVKDPLALPALQMIVGVRSEEDQELVLRVCERIGDPLSTELLAWQAAESPSARLRKLAAEMLEPREMCDYVPLLTAEMYTPVQTKTEATSFGLGGIFVRKAFYREGAEQHELLIADNRFHATYEAQAVRRLGQDVNYAVNADRTLRAAERAVTATDAAVAEQNRLTAARNERIAAALAIATGNNFGPKPEAWWEWWTSYTESPVKKGYAGQYRSTSTAVEGLSLSPAPQIQTLGLAIPRIHSSCLAAGTAIATDQGPVDVEKVKPGDLVLARDIETGELAYKPVIQTTVRDKSQLLKITAGKDTFEATGGHLFWVSGQGWIRARDLKPGQVLHAAGAPVTVLQVEPGPIANAYNLVVADYSSYFVGREQILSHDISPRRPTRVTVPGLESE